MQSQYKNAHAVTFQKKISDGCCSANSYGKCFSSGFSLSFSMLRAIMGVSKMDGPCLMKTIKNIVKRKCEAMDRYKILLVEDDLEISEMLKNYLETENYDVTCAFDGEEACRQFDMAAFSLVLLDLMIPKISGMDVMQHIRSSSFVPVIILSAKDTETDKTLGLALGADDYITKPFSVVEVLARIKANIRRTTQYDNTLAVSHSAAAAQVPAAEEILEVGELIMNLSDHTLMKNGENVELTAKEFEILKLLMQNPKRVYTKEQLYSFVWNDAYFGDENAVNVHISRLRNKIEEDSRNPRYVLTVWGIGYKLGN